MDWSVRNHDDDDDDPASADAANRNGGEVDDLADSLRDLFQPPARMATVRDEARKTLAHNFDVDVDKVDNRLRPGDAPEDVLRRTSTVWAERVESARLYAEKLQHLEGTEQFVAEYVRFRFDRVKTCWEALTNGKFDHLLPEPVLSSRNWFKKLAQQFVLVPTQYSNLTYFGNVMTAVATDFEVVANPGQNMTAMFLARIACLAAPQFNVGQSLMLLLSGDASTGKSHIITKTAAMAPPGWAMPKAHLSPMALSSTMNDDGRCLMIEELPASMTQETFEQTGRDNGSSYLKSLFTNKVVTTSTLSVDKSQRAAPTYVASKMMTGVFGTNGLLVQSSPLLKRYWVHRASHDPEIADKINRLEATSLAKETQTALLREQIMAHLVQLTELMIGMGAIKQPDMSAFVVLWSKLKREMKQLGYDMIEAKSINMAAQLVRTLVIVKAVCAAVLSEKNYELRIDASTREPKRFEDHYQEHFANIESMLAAEEPEILFGISLCSDIFGDNTEGQLLNAARKLIGVEFNDTDDAFTLTKNVNMMPIGVALATNNTHQVQYDPLYLEIPVESRGDDQVNDALRDECTEKPSKNNAKNALDAMTKKNVQHHTMQLERGGEFGKIVPNGDGGTLRSSPMIKRCEFSDTYEKSMVAAANGQKLTGGSGSSKLKPRWYVNVEALRQYMAPARAMKQALSKLQHKHTLPARHIICLPIVAPRHAQTKDEHTFHGIFDFLDFEPDPRHTLTYQSRHAVLPLQSESLRAERVHDGGDPSLHGVSQSMFDDRQVAHTNRTLASQAPVIAVTSPIDSSLMWKRQYECSMPAEHAEVAHWSVFAGFCRAVRKVATDVFAPMREDVMYPDALVAEAQQRNLKIDSTQQNPATAMSFNTLTMSNMQTIPPIPCAEMRAAYRRGGIEAVCGLFVDNRCSRVASPTLEAESLKLIEQDANLSAIWPTAYVIFNNYAQPLPMVQELLRFIDFRIEPRACSDPRIGTTLTIYSTSIIKKRTTFDDDHNDDGEDDDDDERAVSSKRSKLSDESIDDDALYEYAQNPLLVRAEARQQRALHSTVESSVDAAYLKQRRTVLADNSSALVMHNSSSNRHSRVQGTLLVRRY